METIRVSIVEDIAEIREGVQFLLNQTEGFVCVSTYGSAEEAASGLPVQKPDVVIMDINLPGISGIECVRKVKPHLPRTQFMMFTIYEDNEQVFEALAAGASGYLLKKTPLPKIAESLRELHEGGSPMSASIARKLVATFQPTPAGQTLTAREREIVDCLAKGLLYKEIADKASISINTVRQHIHNIYEKLHVQNRTEALNKLYGGR